MVVDRLHDLLLHRAHRQLRPLLLDLRTSFDTHKIRPFFELLGNRRGQILADSLHVLDGIVVKTEHQSGRGIARHFLHLLNIGRTRGRIALIINRDRQLHLHRLMLLVLLRFIRSVNKEGLSLLRRIRVALLILHRRRINRNVKRILLVFIQLQSQFLLVERLLHNVALGLLLSQLAAGLEHGKLIRTQLLLLNLHHQCVMFQLSSLLQLFVTTGNEQAYSNFLQLSRPFALLFHLELSLLLL